MIGAVASGKDGKLAEIPAASMDGKKFDGWYDSDGKKVTQDYVFTKDAKLTARYSNGSSSFPVVIVAALALVVVALIAIVFYMRTKQMTSL